MSVVFVLISASLLIAIGFLVAFIWSVKNDQYEDDYTPSVRILFENDLKQTPINKDQNKQTKNYGTTKISVRQ